MSSISESEDLDDSTSIGGLDLEDTLPPSDTQRASFGKVGIVSIESDESSLDIDIGRVLKTLARRGTVTLRLITDKRDDQDDVESPVEVRQPPSLDASDGANHVTYQIKYQSQKKTILVENLKQKPVIKPIEHTEAKDQWIRICTIVNAVGSKGNIEWDEHASGGRTPKIEDISEVLMTIHAPELVTAIRQIVLYYPSEAISNAASVGHIPVRRPYHMLQLYRKDIAKLRESYNPALHEDSASKTLDIPVAQSDQVEGHNPVSTFDKNPPGGDTITVEDFDIHARMHPPSITCNKTLHSQLLELEEILDEANRREMEEEDRWHQEGKANFDMLWYLFRAGSFVYAKVNNQWTGAAVYVPVRSYDTKSPYKRNGMWSIHCWYLGFDGKKIVRVLEKIRIPAYNGTVEINTLPIYPIKYAKDPGLLQTLIRRGESYYGMLVAQRPQMYYSGELVGEVGTFYSGPIVVDPARAAGRNSSSSLAKSLVKYRELKGRGTIALQYLDRRKDFETLVDDNRGDGILGEKYLWQGFQNIDPLETPKLTPLHYFLFPQQIQGFALQRRKWATFNFDCISSYQSQPHELEKLVLGKEEKLVIEVLTRSAQINSTEVLDQGTAKPGSLSSDRRREARVFLLHGPSGVGKTFTAECVARSTGRPLLSLTCAELGVDETRIESKLEEWFVIAKDWGAVILIDEADVYVDGRGHDVKRGGLVAAFLRALETFRNEFHGGILFLTTNRILKIDLALRSRVHVPIYYPPPKEEHRDQIFKQCVEILGAQVLEDSAFSKFSQGMENMKWNGREIRNALQSVAAMAEGGHPTAGNASPEQSTAVTEAHVQPILSLFRNFKDYFSENQFDEATVARNKGERRDQWESLRKKQEELKEIEVKEQVLASQEKEISDRKRRYKERKKQLAEETKTMENKTKGND